jgi:hypothetical protein
MGVCYDGETQNELTARRSVLIESMNAYYRISVTFTHEGQIHDDEDEDNKMEAHALATGSLLKRTSSHQQRIKERNEQKELRKLNEGGSSSSHHSHHHHHHHYGPVEALLHDDIDDTNNDEDSDRETDDHNDEMKEEEKPITTISAAMGAPQWLNISVTESLVSSLAGLYDAIRMVEASDEIVSRLNVELLRLMHPILTYFPRKCTLNITPSIFVLFLASF